MPSKYIASSSVIGEKVNKENIETKEEKAYSFSKEKENEILEKLKSKDEKVIINILDELFKEISQKTTNEYEKKYGKFKFNKEILEIIKKFSNNQNKQIQYKTFWILERTDLNELKKIIDIYLNSNDQRLRGSAISLIEKDARPNLKEKLIEIAKLPMNEQNELSIYGALRALDNYNDPTIIDRIKSVFEDITEPVEILNEAFRDDDINKLKSLMNEKAGFLLRIIAPGNTYIPNKVIPVKEAIEFFERSEYYNLKNIEGIEFGCQDELSPYVKQDKKGRIYVYITKNDYFGFFEKEGIHILSKAPFVLIGVKCLVKKTNPTEHTNNFRVYFSKIANKWYFVGLEEWQCQK
jgi:soluble P-type ATPase